MNIQLFEQFVPPDHLYCVGMKILSLITSEVSNNSCVLVYVISHEIFHLIIIISKKMALFSLSIGV